MRVRRATADDLEVLAAFNIAMAQETEDKTLSPTVVHAGVEAALADPAHGTYFVVEAREQVIGALLITYEWSDWRNGQFWWIQSVYVQPDWRRGGVFSTLYAYVREAAVEAGACGVRLYVEQGNERAQRTYAALGMEDAGYRIYEWLRN